jgi:hypothetical protein
LFSGEFTGFLRQKAIPGQQVKRFLPEYFMRTAQINWIATENSGEQQTRFKGQKRCKSLHTIRQMFQGFYLQQKTFTSGADRISRAP